MSEGGGKGENGKKVLDLTSRLYASSMLAGALTSSAPKLPWMPSQSTEGTASRSQLVPKIMLQSTGKESAPESKEEKARATHSSGNALVGDIFFHIHVMSSVAYRDITADSINIDGLRYSASTCTQHRINCESRHYVGTFTLHSTKCCKIR